MRGRDPGAACDGMFIVLTNDPDITYERVSRSLYSSNFNDRLKDTVITGMHVLDDNGEIIIFDESKIKLVPDATHDDFGDIELF